jgi:hypothetical protein
LLALLLTLTVPFGWLSSTPAPVPRSAKGSVRQAAPELTAERAKGALIDLIRCPEPGELKDFPLERFEKEGVVRGDSPSWGPFSLDLKAHEYTYDRAFGQPPRVCRWHYRGKFELREGRWVGLPPRVEWQALGPE